jgi:hypothetical protein
MPVVVALVGSRLLDGKTMVILTFSSSEGEAAGEWQS